MSQPTWHFYFIKAVKTLIMKKTFIYLLSLSFALAVVSCGGTRDDKNIAEPYPTTDTTKKVENKNDENNTNRDNTGTTSNEGGH
jgi:hypothetical protein